MTGRVMALAGAAVLAMALAGGIAVARDDITCPGPPIVCQGTTGNDVLRGTPESDDIYADDGSDTLIGKKADDDLRGEEGDDRFDGGAGNDMYYYESGDFGADKFVKDADGSRDWLVMFSSAAQSAEIDLKPKPGVKEVVVGTSTIQIANRVSIEWVQAGSGPDTIRGGKADNYIQGGDLGDIIAGRGGDDHLVGDIAVFTDEGEDVIRGGAGRDDIEAGPLADQIFAKDGEKDKIDCGDGIDVVEYDKGLDELTDCEI